MGISTKQRRDGRDWISSDTAELRWISSGGLARSGQPDSVRNTGQKTPTRTADKTNTEDKNKRQATSLPGNTNKSRRCKVSHSFLLSLTHAGGGASNDMW